MGQHRSYTCINISNWVSLYKGLTHRFIPKHWRKPRFVESKAVAYVSEVQQQAESHVQAMAADMESQAQNWFKPLSNKRKLGFQR